MSKNSSQFPQEPRKIQPVSSQAPSTPNTTLSSKPIQPKTENKGVQPEAMSLMAHRHIQHYLNNKLALSENDLTAVLRLSQHLRVFGLLSAAGYVNQSNSQGGEVRERTVPVWESLLGQLLDENNPPDRKALMEKVCQIAKHEPMTYMALWRKSLILANHWNFWARAYKES